MRNAILRVLFAILTPLWAGVAVLMLRMLNVETAAIGGAQNIDKMGMKYPVMAQYGMVGAAALIALLLLVGVFARAHARTAIPALVTLFATGVLVVLVIPFVPQTSEFIWFIQVTNIIGGPAQFPMGFESFPKAALILSAITWIAGIQTPRGLFVEYTVVKDF